MTNHRRALDPRYAAGELYWYLNPDGELNHIQFYAKQYINFVEPNGIIHGAYGPRLAFQLEEAIELLKREPNTRRCVIALYGQHDISFGAFKKDIPCTLTWNLLIERGKLCMISNMRSNDVWLGMPYDIFVNTCIQRLVAARLGLELGWYQHQAANLHVYQKNYDAAMEAVSARFDERDCWGDRELFISESDIANARAAERVYRNTGIIEHPRNYGMFYDLLSCVTGSCFDNEVLKDAYYRRK